MSDQSYTTTIVVDRTPDEIFDAITNVGDWWPSDLEEGSTKAVGDEFTHQVEGHWAKIRVTEVVPGERVVWRILDNHFSFIDDQSEWINTEIRFELSEQDGGTEVRFTHAGLVPEFACFDVCSNAWRSLIEGNLRSLITAGLGTR